MKGTLNTTSKRKCNYEKVQLTLDVCHNNKYKDFLNKSTSLNVQESDLEKLYLKLSKYQSKCLSNLNDKEIETYFSIKDQIREKENELKKNTTIDSELDYFTKTGNILYDYYELMDNRKKEGDGVSENTISNILDFFTRSTKVSQSNSSSTPGNEPFIKPKRKNSTDETNNKAKLLDEYLYYTDQNYIDNTIKAADEVCYYCNSTNIHTLLHEGIALCYDCNTLEYVITDNDKPSYKEPPKEISYFSYKRINHFNESKILVINIFIKFLANLFLN